MFNEKTREFQKGFDTDARRRDREDDRLKLRKEDREIKLQAKRQAFNDRSYNKPKQNDNNKQPDLNKETVEQLPQYVHGCFTDQVATQFECCQRIRKLLSAENNPPIREVIESGVVPKLIQFLQNSRYTKLQFEATWALTNIASGTVEHTSHVIRNGAIPILIGLLRSPCIEVCDQAVWALGNIAGDSPQCRNLVLDSHILQNLVPFCRPCDLNDVKKLAFLRNATWLLSNLMRGRPSPAIDYIKPVVQALATLLETMEDIQILCDGCWGLSYVLDNETITKDSNTPTNAQLDKEKMKMQLVYESGALKKLIELLNHKNHNVIHPSLRAIGNIVTGPEQQTQQVINLGVLDKLLKLLPSEIPQIKRETCWTISNITAGSPAQIESVINAKIVPVLIRMLAHEKREIQQECAYALANITTTGNSKHIRHLVNQGAIRQFCKLLSTNVDPVCVIVILEGLEHILAMGKRDMPNENKYAKFVEECGGLDILESIQSNDKTPEKIFEQAAFIVKEFFEGQEENNNEGEQHNNTEGKDPTARVDTNNQFEFGFNKENKNISNFDDDQFIF